MSQIHPSLSKEDLIDLCVEYGVLTSGSKGELANNLFGLRREYLPISIKKQIKPYLTYGPHIKKMNKIINVPHRKMPKDYEC